MTLLEVAIASVILLVVSVSFILSMVFANRVAKLSSIQLAAAHILQGEVERVRATVYDRVNTAAFPDISSGVYLDQERRIPATINYDVLSTFSVTSGGTSSVTVGNIPTNAMRNGTFTNNELTSNLLVITQGRGLTQVGVIKSNTADTISITTDRSGGTNQNWYITPDSTSVVQLNMGKVVTVRVGWTYDGKQYSQEMRTLVVLPMDL